MLSTTEKGETFNLEKDFSSPERHILQKLFLWQGLAENIEVFRRKKAQALRAGWNNSGPVRESPALTCVAQDLEKRLSRRLQVS
jgi:hypothetical protein|uniref:Uncharacterized protein n=1 Tax=Desulfobacca acetoxidans TaxID=60893 RepID=A0A7V6A5E4_9BACT